MRNPLRVTYRLQIRPEFSLDDAAAIVPYLDELGVSHLYTSPILQAVPGSTHGYDIVDYGKISQDFGDQKALDRLFAELDRTRSEQDTHPIASHPATQMGLVMDIVPNHMAIHPNNAWLWDVLQNGQSSRYASYFDIIHILGGSNSAKTILIPALGDHYGRELEAGKIQLEFHGLDFTVRYGVYLYPVDPSTLGPILEMASERVLSSRNDAGGEELAFLAGAFQRLPGAQSTGQYSADLRSRDAKVLQDLLARLVKEQPGVRKAIQEIITMTNQDPDALDAFLSRQNYRLALWKISADELSYRRFFNINSLIGLRMENPAAYRDAHALVVDLVRREKVDGLRIDHPDGLRNPCQYFEWLREDAPDTWIVVEKILASDESLPETWPVQGTTGYDFLNRANGLFVDPEGERPLSEFYASFTGRVEDYPTLVHKTKLLAAKELLGPDLNQLTNLFLQVCERHRLYRDSTRSELNDVLAETAACLPVYRTYVEVDGRLSEAEERAIMQADVGTIDQAIQAAKNNRPDLDPRLFDFFADLLKLKVSGPLEEDLLARFQQFTGPVMAKGVEDRAFYIFNRFVSLNEVGGNPARFGQTVAEFHRACRETQTYWPQTLLATSTHDTKRSEDVRARLNVISEIPDEWARSVRRWAEMNEKHRRGNYPDRNGEYLLYQTLAGAWPITPGRAVEYMRKAGREAGEFTNWVAPNLQYEEAVETFVRAILGDSRFTADLETFVAEILEPGQINSLAQTLLKLAAPGIPDIYQGTEIWNLGLVDPDNRRLVDYDLRRQMLRSMFDDSPPETILARMDIGLPKLWVIRQGLALRRKHPDWFDAGSAYTPLQIEHPHREAMPERQAEETVIISEEAEKEGLLVAVTGSPKVGREDPAVAFLRGTNVLVAVPRLIVHFGAVWDRYHLTVPSGEWRNWLTHEVIAGGKISLAELFSRFPAALLAREA